MAEPTVKDKNIIHYMKVVCKDCGKSLSKAYNWSADTLTVEPCSFCLRKARRGVIITEDTDD